MIRNVPKAEPEKGQWTISDEMVANGEQLTCVTPSGGNTKNPCVTRRNKRLFCKAGFNQIVTAELNISVSNIFDRIFGFWPKL
mgnify:CR=1 FL=1